MEPKRDEIVKHQLETAFTADVLEWGKEYMQRFTKLMAYYRCAMMEIETKLHVLDVEFSLQYDRNPINSIKTRLKSAESMREKLQKMGLPLSISAIEDNLSDVAGVRVICAFEKDVYTIAKSLLQQDDIQLIEEKDYIKNPKLNGYRSLHLIVTVPIFLAHEKKLMRVEIQLRTIAMDSWASLEHQLRYKKDNVFTDEMKAELLHCANLSAELDARMDSLRSQVKT